MKAGAHYRGSVMKVKEIAHKQTAAFRPHTTQREDPAPPILGGLHHERGLESSTFVRLTPKMLTGGKD